MSAARRIDLTAAGERCAGLAERVADARLVCFPTDTVYGVGGRVSAGVAAALTAAKERAADKPLQVVFPSLAALEDARAVAPELLAVCRRLLPGPLTLVVPYPAGWSFPAPGAVRWGAPGGLGGAPLPPVETLGVRVPDWPRGARCLGALEEPLLASSANPSGGAPPAALDEVDAALLARCDLVLDGGRVSGVASTVLDLTRFAVEGRWRILRAGPWGTERLAEVLGAAGEEPA